MHLLGLSGNPRRYAILSDDFLLSLIPLHRFITVSALITGAVQFVFLFNLFWSMYRGQHAPANPWNATSLEWSVSSPPPLGNFAEEPIVNCGAYEYGQTNLGSDFAMQADPESVRVKQ